MNPDQGSLHVLQLIPYVFLYSERTRLYIFILNSQPYTYALFFSNNTIYSYYEVRSNSMRDLWCSYLDLVRAGTLCNPTST